MATKVRTYPRTNLGNRSQISASRTFSPGFRSMTVTQRMARMKAQTPMKMSMKTFTVVVAMRIQPSAHSTPMHVDGLGPDQGVGDGPRRHRSAVGLDRQAHPGSGHHGLW